MSTKFFHRELSNGISVICEKMPSATSAGVGLFVATGSRDETPEISGVSHFLEHMMFKGSEKRDAFAINNAFGEIGAQANAFTSEENTVYYAHVLPEHSIAALDIITDMFGPNLAQEDFNMEKKVILEEIALYKDKPHFVLFESANRDYYGGHSAGSSVLGTTESISALPLEAMRNYFQRRYSADSITVVATGNINPEEIYALAEKSLNHLSHREKRAIFEPFATNPISRKYSKAGLIQGHYLLTSEGPSATDEERLDIGVLGLILGDSVGSRLYWELIHSGVCDSAQASNDEKHGTGAFSIYASCSPDKLDVVKEKIGVVIRAASVITEDELARAKRKLASRIVMGGELPMGRLFALGMDYAYRNKLNELAENLAKVEKISLKSIAKALERFPLSSWAEFSLVPE